MNHVPKTGGHSLLAVCRQNLSDSEISPHLWEQDIRSLRKERFEHYRLIRGHFSILSQAGFVRDRYSMTLLRHPIRTIASAYEFWRAAPEQNTVTFKAKELPFPEYVRYFADSPTLIDNPYTHHFGAVPRDVSGTPEDNSLLLATAKHNVAAFDFVGITEEMGPSIRLLCEELGWRAPAAAPRENASGSERLFDRIDPHTMELLLERNRLDLELYAYAKALFRSAQLRRSAGAHLSDGSENRLLRTTEANRFVAFPVPIAPQRTASIQRVLAEWGSGELSRTLHVIVGFRTKVRIETLKAGVLIQDRDGNVVYATNTHIENVEVKNAPDCSCRAAFVLDCDIEPGMYFVTVALSDYRRLGFQYHWIDRATSFEVVPNNSGTRTRSGIRLRAFESTLEAASADMPPQPSRIEEDRDLTGPAPVTALPQRE